MISLLVSIFAGRKCNLVGNTLTRVILFGIQYQTTFIMFAHKSHTGAMVSFHITNIFLTSPFLMKFETGLNCSLKQTKENE